MSAAIEYDGKIWAEKNDAATNCALCRIHVLLAKKPYPATIRYLYLVTLNQRDQIQSIASPYRIKCGWFISNRVRFRNF